MWPFNKIGVEGPEPPKPNAEAHTPECMRFDTEERSDFGTQVVMLMELEPDTWSVHPSFRCFSHPRLGAFVFNDKGRLVHAGDFSAYSSYSSGSLSPAGKQRAITVGDQKVIVESLRAMLLKPMSLEESKAPASAGVYQQTLQAQKQSLTPDVYKQQQQLEAYKQHQLEAYKHLFSQTLPSLKLDDGKIHDLFIDRPADCIGRLEQGPTLR